MMKHLLKYTLGAGLLLSMAACGDKKTGKDAKAELEQLRKDKISLSEKITELEKKIGVVDSGRVVNVVTNSITPIMFRNYIDVQGRVDAEQSVLATSEAPGIVQNIYVQNGQYVRKGQVLATLKSESIITDDIDKGVAEIDQQIQFAKTLLDKQRRLWDQEIGTEVQLLAAKNNYESLIKRKQTIEVSRKRVGIAKKSFSIIAPINGMVDGLDLRIGQMVAPGMVGIKLVNMGVLKVKIDIPENYGSKVSAGKDVMVVFTDLNDTIQSRIQYVSPTVNPVSRTFDAEVPLSANAKYRPNMTTQVKIVAYANDRAFVLPASIIQKTADGDFVYIDEGGKAKLRRITTGQSYMGKIEITSGLNLGDLVIINGFQDLNEGDRLKTEL
jgi:membrane fusion protein, multidrug efflux system